MQPLSKCRCARTPIQRVGNTPGSRPNGLYGVNPWPLQRGRRTDVAVEQRAPAQIDSVVLGSSRQAIKWEDLDNVHDGLQS